MKTGMAILLMLLSAHSYSQLALIPEKGSQQFFSGNGRKIAVAWTNSGDEPLRIELRGRLYEADSATAMPLGDTPSTKLEIMAHQTVLESMTLDFPLVRAETAFVFRWVEGTNRVRGASHVVVYPSNLLAELKPMAGGEPLGISDPENILKPLLQVTGLQIHDLERCENFSGKLAIFGPFESQSPISADKECRIKRLAQDGVAVLWIVPKLNSRDRLMPSFYLIPGGKGVVVAQSSLVTNLRDDPRAQLNLLNLARFACNPYPLTWPLAENE